MGHVEKEEGTAGANFKADSFQVVRFPVLPYTVLDSLAKADDESLSRVIREHVADPYTREALYLASPALFERTREWESSGKNFNGLERAISRYLLRMAYRATPFGTFSCVATSAAGDVQGSALLPPREQMRRSACIDSAVLSGFADTVRSREGLKEHVRYSVNDTMLVKGRTVVFMAYHRGAKWKKLFRRIELERDVYLDHVLEIARERLTVDQIIDKASGFFGQSMARNELEQYVWQLVQEQALCADELVSITGGDPLDTLIDEVPSSLDVSARLRDVQAMIHSLNGADQLDVPSAYDKVADAIRSADLPVSRRSVVKVDLHGPSVDLPSLNEGLLEKLEGAVNGLLTLKEREGPLATFAKRFSDRYGDSEVPLLQVVDELESLGFGRASSLPALTRFVARGKADQLTERAGLTQLLERILATSAVSESLYVDLSSVMVVTPRRPQHPVNQSNVLVAWIALWESEGTDVSGATLEVRSVGSQEPGRVMGRFAKEGERIQSYLRELANHDDENLVAEIVHLPQDRVGNISARAVTSEYEVRIRGGHSPSATLIRLDDLVVSISGGRVRIRSKTHARYVTLQMSSAHGFDHPDNLPVYRFLNHVSKQGYTAEMPSLRKWLPSLAYAPGLTWNGVIIARPTWLVEGRVLAGAKGAGSLAARQELQRLRAERRLPKWVALEDWDRVIPFDLDSEWMQDELIREISQRKSVVLTDVFPMHMRPHLKSIGGAHFHEIQVAMREERRTTRLATDIQGSSDAKAVVPVWGEWCYLKLYVPPHQQSAVLLRIAPELDALKESGRIHGYFFVRYEDEGGAHVRLRLHATSPGSILSCPEIRAVLDEMHRDRAIHSVVIEPYVREVTRYGGDRRTSLCEKIFCIDSEVIVSLLPEFDQSDTSSWRVAAVSIHYLLHALGLTSLEEKLEFARRAARDFDFEMQFGANERRQIGKIYRASKALLTSGAEPDSSLPGLKSLLNASESISQLWREVVEGADTPLTDARAYQMRWSLIHMRLNRLFERDPRLQEAVVWELLKRSYLAVTHRDRTVEPAGLCGDDLPSAQEEAMR